MSSNLMRNDPWAMMTKMQNEMNRWLGGNGMDDAVISATDWIPSVDIKEEPTRFVVHADIPGVDPKDVEITAENGNLTIQGRRASEQKEERKNYLRIERSSGSFLRRFTLPDTADAGHIVAKADKGVLEVTIPKKSKAEAKRIPVGT